MITEHMKQTISTCKRLANNSLQVIGEKKMETWLEYEGETPARVMAKFQRKVYQVEGPANFQYIVIA